MISCRTVESTCLEFDTTKYIPTTDNDDNFKLLILYEMCYLLREESQEFWVDPISLISLEGFT
jgi:hypothetical protein